MIKNESKGEQIVYTCLLHYTEPFDYEGILAFMRPRAMIGVEVITEDSYSRSFRLEEGRGYFTVTIDRDKSALVLHIVCNHKACYKCIYDRVRQMFDLDRDLMAISRAFCQDPILSRGMVDGCVPRLPVAYNPFEHTIRAILGQQITVKAATTLAGRIVAKGGVKTPEHYPDGLAYYFPTPAEFVGIDLDDVGLTKARKATIEQVASAIANGDVRLDPDQSFDDFYRAFSVIKGIGDWTVNYVAMRGMGMVDTFPAKDLGIVKALTVGEKKPKLREILEIAEGWRPYRAYAALCLWRYVIMRDGQ